MLHIVFWIISFLISCGLFTTLWARVGPRVYALTKSHAVQIAAMAAVLLVPFIIYGLIFSWLLSFFE